MVYLTKEPKLPVFQDEIKNPIFKEECRHCHTKPDCIYLLTRLQVYVCQDCYRKFEILTTDSRYQS